MILLIDNYDSFTYNLKQSFLMQNEKVHVIRNDQVTLDEIEKMDLKGIVLSPGPGRPEDAGLCIRIVQMMGPKIPILGVCLGHQAIGAAFGATVNGAKDILHGKDSPIFHYRTPLFDQMPLPFKAGRYHSLVVDQVDLPAELKVDAEDADGYVMALSHINYPIYGVQFHPESILTPEGEKIIRNFIRICERSQQRSKSC